MDYTKKRESLVKGLKLKGIKDSKVLEALLKVPRHDFIGKNLTIDPYKDGPQSIGYGQTISQPYIVALMTESLKLKGSETVLEIGTGCGYQTAILCELVKKVYSIERIKELSLKADKNLTAQGYQNYELKLDDGTIGWQEKAPFDAIIVTATAPDIPEPLINQLATGGRMVIPVGKDSPQELICITKTSENFIKEYICRVYFVPLIGKYGWKN